MYHIVHLNYIATINSIFSYCMAGNIDVEFNLML